LLQRWAELRTRLVPGKCWQPDDKFKAIRLLGKQPLDASSTPQVAIVFLAAHEIDPTRRDHAFIELRSEVEAYELNAILKRVDGLPLEPPRRGDATGARQILIEIVDRATGRLEAIAELNRQRAERAAALALDRLACDDTIEGERLRRYETAISRTLSRTLDDLSKVRRVADDRRRAEKTGTDDFNELGPKIPKHLLALLTDEDQRELEEEFWAEHHDLDDSDDETDWSDDDQGPATDECDFQNERSWRSAAPNPMKMESA
jgi:hypothetical protein